jgi:TRAP-type C4-dicarboxylate transport system permease small subunit
MDSTVTTAAETRAASATALRLRLADIPKLVVAALLGVAIINLLVGVFLRYIMIEVTDFLDRDPIGFFWVEETGEFALAWMTLIGAAVGIAERSHFTLEVLTHRFPIRVQHIIRKINYVLIAGFGLFAAWQGWRLTMLNATLMSPGLGINLGWLYFSAVVGGLLIAIYAAGALFGLISVREEGH